MIKAALLILTLLITSSCNSQSEQPVQNAANNKESQMGSNLETATVGGGCFWCIEAVFEGFKGVEKVVSGYAGGSVKNPSYEQVSLGSTGHAEVIQIHFDPKVISYHDLLTIFFHAHDPTTPNRQGADVGTQYRSIILYHSEAQRQTAEAVKKEIGDSKLWNAPIVTETKPFDQFYSAEDYHQSYFQNNPNKPYCAIVIAPKVQKIYKEFHDKLKNTTKS